MKVNLERNGTFYNVRNGSTNNAGKNGLRNGNVYFLMTPTVYTSLGGGDETSTKIADPVSPVVVEV